MPLTSADVRNVVFTKTPIGKRGFDAEEVDAFLVEVQNEMARLTDENVRLRALVEDAAEPTGPDLAEQVVRLRSELSHAVRELSSAEHAALALHARLDEAHGQQGSTVADTGRGIVGVLAVARRTADACVGDARREAAQLLADAHAVARQVAHEARIKADRLEQDARRRHRAALAAVDAKRATLRHEIQRLEQFERGYYTRLKAELESRIGEVDGPGQHREPDSAAYEEHARRAP